jgi:hypothetical protein
MALTHRTLLAAITAMLMATTARGQELPNYPIRNEDDRMVYDALCHVVGQ